MGHFICAGTNVTVSLLSAVNHGGQASILEAAFYRWLLVIFFLGFEPSFDP
jgi:hypothetical protein